MNFLGIFCSLFIISGLWTPLSLEQFCLTTDQTNLLTFVTDQSQPLSPDFNIYDMEGNLFLSDQGEISQNQLILSLKLPQGFYEIEFPETKQRFGLISQPYYCGITKDSEPKSPQNKASQDIQSADSFFAIDGALSWLVSDDDIREQLVKIAQKVGIQTLRERLLWSHIEPEQGKIDFESSSRYQKLRSVCETNGLPILELFHDAPNWLGKIEKYPRNLVQTYDSWKSIQDQWSSCWGSLEAWNEPDIHFGGDLPADQYVPILKTMSCLFEQQKEKSPILGGSIAIYQDQWMTTAAKSGLLDYCDIFSFHTYCHSLQMQEIIAKFQKWLSENNEPGKPVWITECGRPWKKGTDRPNSVEDKASAIDIIMKGIETKACGFERYFPFVYPFYEENDNNFGMMDKNYAPLRSFAAYVQMIRVMSHQNYIGDPILSSDANVNVDRMRAFSNHLGERLIVFYSANPQKDAHITLPFLPKRIETITGEVKEIIENKNDHKAKSDHLINSNQNINSEHNYRVDFSDGFLYVWVPEGFEFSVDSETILGKIQKERLTAQEKGFKERKAAPIILQYSYDSELVEANRNGYHILQKASDSMKIEIVAWNLSSVSQKIPVHCSASQQNVLLDYPNSIEIPARSSVSFKIQLNIRAISSITPFELSISAQDQILLRFTKEISSEEFSTLTKTQTVLEIDKKENWTKNQPTCCQLTFLTKEQLGQESKWGVQTTFTEGDHWFYPFFQLPENVDLSQYDGLVLRVKGQKDETGEIRIFCYEEGAGSWFTSQSVVACDDDWHYAIIPFKEFVAFETDLNNHFDREKVRRISVGGNTKSDQFSIEVSDLILFKL